MITYVSEMEANTAALEIHRRGNERRSVGRSNRWVAEDETQICAAYRVVMYRVAIGE